MMERGELRSTFYELDRKMDVLRSRVDGASAAESGFLQRLETSWIYHEHAMEGIVLTQDEITAALESQPVLDISLAPVYEEVRRHKAAIEHVRKLASKRRTGVSLDLARKLHLLFFDNGDAKLAGKYRRDMPIHRLYFHEITPPDKIAAKMKQLFDWVDSPEARRMHPVKFAATLHYQLMRIYPYSHHSGKLSRLLMNFVLLQSDYLPAIIHAVERQRYYESLRLPPATSIGLVIESLENGVNAALKLVVSRRESARAAV
jgi:Fic family protein